MRFFGRLALVASLIALVSVTTQAQQRQGGGPGMMGMGGLPMLLSNKSVQEELKLDAAQVEKVNKIVTEQREKSRTAMQGLRDLEPAQRREKMQGMMTTAQQETIKALREGEVLKPEQFRRLMQINLQVTGPRILTTNARLAERMKVTDEQKKKIEAVLEESMTKTREAMQGAGNDRAAAMEKMQNLRKETNEKALAVLSAEQQENFKKAQGEPFSIKFERPNR